MRIGLDLDNTIACYAGVFPALAEEAGVPPNVARAGKIAIRGFLREEGREDEWTEMQGVAYGARMNLAPCYPGVLDFIADAASRGCSLSVVSHRTRAPYRGRAHDLHDAARRWVEAQGIDVPVYLETTAQAKAARIAELGCDVFVDDLPEFLGREDLPRTLRRVLFDPDRVASANQPHEAVVSWAELRGLLFSR